MSKWYGIQSNLITSPSWGGQNFIFEILGGGIARKPEDQNAKPLRLSSPQTPNRCRTKTLAHITRPQTFQLPLSTPGPIGPYVADFICHTAKLVIELGGGQHNEVKGIASDTRRTAWLEAEGYKVIRFWNNDVLTNIEGVQTAIRSTLGLDLPPPKISEMKF